MSNIFEKTNQFFNQNLPFVLYCKPNSVQLIGIFQKDNRLHQVKDFAEKGFVFSNFQGTESVFFPENECDVVIDSLVLNQTEKVLKVKNTSEDGKIPFENLVQKGINLIQKGSFEKVVLSRKESISVANLDFLAVFQKMLNAYQNTFRYCWFHPKIGLWMGASPEQLLKVQDLKFETVALAGTQKFDREVEANWREKEKQEQKFVTDFIVSELSDEVQSISQTDPFNFQAGNVVHLKTNIKGVFKSDFDLKKVLRVLHPTPAVCGLPKEVAKDFILKNEAYDRKFYAGFLGELNGSLDENSNKNSDLFVNLRCMEIERNQVHLYVGCGITKDSIPENEYFETANKAMTMKEILM